MRWCGRPAAVGLHAPAAILERGRGTVETVPAQDIEIDDACDDILGVRYGRLRHDPGGVHGRSQGERIELWVHPLGMGPPGAPPVAQCAK